MWTFTEASSRLVMFSGHPDHPCVGNNNNLDFHHRAIHHGTVTLGANNQLAREKRDLEEA